MDSKESVKVSRGSRRSYFLSFRWLPWLRGSKSTINEEEEENPGEGEISNARRRRGSSSSSWRPWIDLERLGWRRISSEIKPVNSRSRPTSSRGIPRRNHSSHNFLSVLATNPRPSACPRVAQRKLSEAGILKPSSVETTELVSTPRKSVSFSPEDSVKIFEDLASEVSRCSHLSEEERLSLLASVRPRSLIPTFVFPAKRPGFVDDVNSAVVLLENVNVCSADEGAMTVLGSVVVNPSVLQRHASISGPIIKCRVQAKFTMDNWISTQFVSAYRLTKTRRPELNHCQTYRFVIDASDMNVGEELHLGVYCTPIGLDDLVFVDENHGLFYTLRCTTKLNQWAERAALELRNFAPAVKYNKNLD